MYQALGLKKLLSSFLSLSALVALGLIWISPPDGLFDWLRIASSASFYSGMIILGIGESLIFKWIWQTSFAQNHFFPFIHGKWKGTISSNWSVISAAYDAAASTIPLDSKKLNVNELGSYNKDVEIEIKASLLNVTMKLTPKDIYSDSLTIILKPVQVGDNGHPRLYYMYRSIVQVPLATDGQMHYGAAWLDVYRTGRKLELRGVYFTDREWTKGMNTAGTLQVTKLN